MERNTNEMNVLELLLSNEPPKGKEKEFRIKRLSEAWGQEVVFRLKGLGYNRVMDMRNGDDKETSIQIVLSGVTSPNLKDQKLLTKYNAPTAGEMLKKLLLPGEIEDLSRAIEKLSGYRVATIEEIKKK
ncbi:MAG: hypothetical protein VB018_13295 [Lachnospiraceae bacterium]|nr:hypothetical protein [Lachnospiraceae bacterium]